MNNPSLPFQLAARAYCIGTPLERPVRSLRWWASLLGGVRHPELWPTYLEDSYLDKILGRLLQKDSEVVDVGCHLGSFLNRVVKLAPAGVHTAIEPSLAKAAWLQRRYPGVRVEQCAVSDRPGLQVFEENSENAGYSKIAGENRVPSHRYYEVRVAELDTLLQDKPKISMIKLDVEGHEFSALNGATKVIERHRPAIIFECGGQYEYTGGAEGRMKLFELMTAQLRYDVHSFSDYIFGKGGLTESEFRKAGIYPFPYFNYLALPKESSNSIYTP